MRDIASGKTKADVKTRRRGRAIVRGGMGTGRRTVGFLGALLTYAREAGIIDTNPAHGIRKAADQKRTRRLSEDEYRLLGKLLAKAMADDQLRTSAKITRLLALTGLPARRDPQPDLVRGGHRQQLSSPPRYQGGRVRAPDRTSRRRYAGDGSAA